MDTDGSIYSEKWLFDKKLVLENEKKRQYVEGINSVFGRRMLSWEYKGIFDTKIGERLLEERVMFTYLKIVQETNSKNLVDGKFPKGIRFCLLQSRKIKKRENKILVDLVKFYNENFTGNKDFIHIPSLDEVIENSKFPILLAINKNANGKEEILGTATVKFERDLNVKDNPYFPVKDKYVLSVNGILTKLNLNDSNGNRIKGIGRELFKIAIAGAHEVNRHMDLELMCKVDCRNNKSMESIVAATEELRKIGINAGAKIEGYYELRDDEERLTEAPTFVVVIHFNKIKELYNRMIEFSYDKCNNNTLYEDIKNVICSKTKERAVYKNRDNGNDVIYHKIKPLNLNMCKVNVGISDLGNSRVPLKVNLFA